MKITKLLILCAVLMGALQAIVGIAALAWAWPLFADPPFLSQGLTEEYSRVRQLLSSNSLETETLSALRLKLEWLFAQQIEGVVVGLALGAFLLVNGLVLFGLGARSWSLLRKHDDSYA